MLKKIATADLRLGMYVHQLCGSWLDHPFWKKRFLLEDPKQLAQLRASPIREVWIDVQRGIDAFEDTEILDEGTSIETILDDDREPAMLAPDYFISTADDDRPTSLAEELVRAKRIVGQAKGAMDAMFQDVRLGRAVDAEHCVPLVNDITSSVKRNPGAIVSLARLKTSDDYTYMHSVAVCALMIALARQLGLSEDETRAAGMGGLVHDVGKAVMPIEILNKPGALTNDEYAVMKTHTTVGHAMLLEARGVGPDALDVSLHHHEKINGTGYPHRLSGDAISLYARMGAVTDVYDAITSRRAYKDGWNPAVSVQRMAQWTRDGHFDEKIFQAFVKSVGIYPIGSLVRMRSDRLAVIVDRSGTNLLAPIVTTFFDAKARVPIARETVDLARPGCNDRIESREDFAAWGFDDLDDLWLHPAVRMPAVTSPLAESYSSSAQ